MAVKTQGTKLYVKNNGNFVEITGIQSISMSGGEAEKIDTTALGDTSPSSVRGMETALSVTVDINYDPADTSHQIMDAFKANGASTNYKTLFNFSGATNTKFFTGEVLSFPELPTMERNALLKKALGLTVNNVRATE